MPGLGAESKLGIAYEVSPSTGLEPDVCIPFTSEGFSAPRTLLESETIGGSSMLKNAVPGDSESSGSITQEFDAESSSLLLHLWNGPNGYDDPSAPFVDGQITAKPTGSAAGTEGTIPSGDWIYQVCAVWTNDATGKNIIMPKSAASDAVTVVLGEKVTIGWTNPTGLALAGHTYKGTAVFRSTLNGAATTCRFLTFIVGSGTGTTDEGLFTPDPTIEPVPNTNLYKHTLEGAEAETNKDRLKYFSVQISKNVGSDERYFGNKANEISLEIGDRASAVSLTMSTMGDDYETVAGEFAVNAPTPRRQILGRDVALLIDGQKNCDIQSFSMTGTNNCNRLGTLCGNTISEGARRINGSFTLLFRNRDLYNKAQASDELSMELWVLGEPLVTNGSTLSLSKHGVDAVPFPRIAIFKFERVQIGEFTNPVEGPDQIIATASWVAMEDSVSETDMEMILINTIADFDAALTAS